jgi:predicted transcriptional regulator of viral defense system
MDKKPNYQKLYDIAENQAGYFSSSQAKTVGFSWERLSNLTKSGKFHRIEKSIYRISQFPFSSFEDLHIALLKSGPNAVISHETALSLYELSDAMPGEIHITFPRTSSRRRKGIRYHTKTITNKEITSYQGLRVTTVARTIIDLIVSGFEPVQIKKAIDQAIQRGMITKEDLIHEARKKGKMVNKKISLYLANENE